MPEGGGTTAATRSDSGATQKPVQPGVLDELSRVFVSVRTAFSDFLELVSLEARRAGLALMWMVVCGVVAALCIVSAWLGLMVALIMWAVSLGCPPVLAVLAITIINGAAGAALIYRGISMSHDLLFSATRRRLSGKSPVLPVTT